MSSGAENDNSMTCGHVLSSGGLADGGSVVSLPTGTPLRMALSSKLLSLSASLSLSPPCGAHYTQNVHRTNCVMMKV